MDEEDDTSNAVDLYDLKTKTWTKGPDFPSTAKFKGFGVSAFGWKDAVYAMAGDGELYRHAPGEEAWSKTGKVAEKPRFFHRLLPFDGRFYVLGGAVIGAGHTDDVEILDMNRAAPAGAKADCWPGFRGFGDSHSEAKHLPVEWSDQKNILWRRSLPGYGQSSPVVWGGRVFVTSAEGEEKESFLVTCLDRSTGKTLWTDKFNPPQRVKSTDMVSRSAPTPVLDADRLYVLSEGGVLASLSHDGRRIWERNLTGDYGIFAGNHGIGSSPVLAGDRLVVLIQHDGPSYVLCVNPVNGQTLWKTDHEKRVSWSSPVFVPDDQGGEILVSSNGSVEAYDPKTGEKRWSADGLKMNTVPSPTVSGDRVIVGTSDRDFSVAIRRSGPGRGGVVWKAEDASITFCSPLVAEGAVYYVNRAGVVQCVDLETGGKKWDHRISSSCWASPVFAEGLLWFFAKDGVTTVMKAGISSPEVISESKLTLSAGTRVYGVAVVEGVWLIRTGDELICAGLPEKR